MGETAVWRLNTNGVMAQSGTIRETVVPDSWIFGVLADVNGDGRPEMIWFPTNAVPQTWFLDENYQYSSNATFNHTPVPASYQFRCAGDVTGTGVDALISQHVDWNYLDTWYVDPDGVLRSILTDSIHLDWRLRDSGDVNGDGRAELFFQNTNSGATQIWFWNSYGVVPLEGRVPMYTGTVDRVWTMVCAADVNGDGRVELIWHHSDGSTRVSFLNTNGTLARHRAMRSTPMATKWRMAGVYSP